MPQPDASLGENHFDDSLQIICILTIWYQTSNKVPEINGSSRLRSSLAASTLSDGIADTIDNGVTRETQTMVDWHAKSRETPRRVAATKRSG